MTTDAAHARYPLTQGVNPWLVTTAVMLPTFMEVLDTAIASVAQDAPGQKRDMGHPDGRIGTN